jgi:hypothetical protein
MEIVLERSAGATPRAMPSACSRSVANLRRSRASGRAASRQKRLMPTPWLSLLEALLIPSQQKGSSSGGQSKLIGGSSHLKPSLPPYRCRQSASDRSPARASSKADQKASRTPPTASSILRASCFLLLTKLLGAMMTSNRSPGGDPAIRMAQFHRRRCLPACCR